MKASNTKVPEITIYFWIVKILTTAMGESTSDYFVLHIDPVVAVAIGLVGLIIALVLQFRAQRYVAWIYWFTVIMIAIFGTMAADVLHVVVGIPYLVSTSFFAVALCIIFALWYASEKTLSIHSITTTRRETFYWLTILTTFALGTAVGDLTAVTFGWGYLYSGLVFGVLIALVAFGHYLVKSILGMEHRRQSRNAVFAFWLAYILTRPLGASFADWAGKSQSIGGLGWGDGTVSLMLLALIVCFVGYLSVSRRDVKN
jgi:uncharacterized membrane-anchored protein